MTFNMRLHYGAAVLTLVALLTGCTASSPDKPVPKKPIAAAEVCDGMFGKETNRSLERLLGGRTQFYPRTGGEAKTVERVATQMRNQVGDSRSPGATFKAFSACSFLLCDEGPRVTCGGKREVDFFFGWTRKRDFPVKKYDGIIPFAAGDAALSMEVDNANELPVTARFECRIPDGGGIVQGSFKGYWDNELSIKEEDKARLRLVLNVD